MALTRITSGGIAEGVKIVFDSNNTPTAPAIRFKNPDDTGTGIYQPADNELAISTAGQPRLTFKADGTIITGNNTILGGTNPNFEGAENITLYVNQSDLNATDAEANDGGNLNRPFKTIERALLEAAKRSYKANPAPISVTALEVGKAYTITSAGNTDFVSIGASSNSENVSFIATAQGTGTGTVTLSNDKFEAFTIMVLPGQYEIDNRPGYDITTNPLVAGTATTIDAEPFRFNPRNGGVIVPRGTSIVGYDLRKTVIRPKYVPDPFSTEGSLTGDGYVLAQVMYDGANMIEKNRGYIQEQTKLYLENAQSATYNALSQAQKRLCVRDIGYFIDAICSDLRQGGNENTFNNAEYYIDGNGYRKEFMKSDDSDVSQEIAATVAAFNHAIQIMRSIVRTSGDITPANNAPTFYSGGSIELTTFTPGTGYLVNGDCSTVVSAVATLGAIATGILNNPDDYTTESVSYIPAGGGNPVSIKLRKTQGIFKQTSIFKVTGGCYFWQMTFKDAAATASKPIYNSASFNSITGVPTFTTTTNSNYSHHKVVAFTYADQRTTDGELDQYYKKIDAWQGRTSPSQVRPEEFTIVGDGSKTSRIDTVNSCSPYIFNCSLRSVFGMCGMHTDGSKVAENSFKSMVVAQFTGISLQRDGRVFVQPKDREGDTSDTASPNATTQYNDYSESTESIPPIYADPDADYKPDCRHFHIKASNGGFIQVVSVFAVGYADQFLAESGGDMSITNSNSNFGQISLRAKGSQFNSFKPASQGRITALIPPRGISNSAQDVSFYAIDAKAVWNQTGIGSVVTTEEVTDQVQAALDGFKNTGNFRLYLQTGATNNDTIPELIVENTNYGGTPDGNGNYPTEIKRFLNYGSSGQYALFRDFYTTNGICDVSQRKLKLFLESTTVGEQSKTYNITLNTEFDQETDNYPGTDNTERIGYFWDTTLNSVYVKLENDAETNLFLEEFIFASNSEKTFTFEPKFDEKTNSTIAVLTSGTVKKLKYKNGYPSNLTVSKYNDNRDSTPSDLLWRIEYTIPKYLPSGIIPKAPEKRFIIKGTRAGNGEDLIPYSDYRFMVWDVEEVQAWDKDKKDGIYFLTVIRADVNKFVDIYDTASNTNKVTTIVRRPNGIANTHPSTTIEELNLYDKDTKLIGNVNYLYPSVNQEAPTYDSRRIWNPPQSDSRVLVEKLTTVGNRVKDVTVPNYKRYNSNISSTPFKDIPALYSMTAEAVHRLVQALDLRYIHDVGSIRYASSNRIWVAPVSSWDSRASGQTSLGYSPTSNDIYLQNYRYGYDVNSTAGKLFKVDELANYNNFGIDGEALDRRILVCSPESENIGPSNTTPAYIIPNATLLENSASNPTGLTFAPILRLYRPSILRASSHTWEYIGLGSGNYSTGFPNLQTRVLKLYEQFIAQGYENSGGFVASSGTNSAGDFYIGNQIIQAGGTSTVTLNVPKIRKSSESNFVDVENIENRISNAVINITTSGRATAQQAALKDLTNFFNITKLTVSDTANIKNLVTERLFLDRPEVNNGIFFPEGNTTYYGFTKGAKPENTGKISTDTNDKLYVSPKYLDAWRIKRQLISAAAVTLDNNRVYIQPYLQSSLSGYVSSVDNNVSYNSATALTYTSTTVNGVNASVSNTDLIKLKVSETAGIASFGKIDIDMQISGMSIDDYYIDETTNEKIFVNPSAVIPLSYESVDYTTNEIVISKVQNGLPIIDYLKSYLGSGSHNNVIKNYPPLGTQNSTGPLGPAQNISESDIKYLKAKLKTNFVANNHKNIRKNDRNTYATIQIEINSQAEYDQWPDRGSIALRQYPKDDPVYKIASYLYYKKSYNLATTTATFVLFANNSAVSNVAGNAATFTSDYQNNYPGTASRNVFFVGCSTLVYDSDRWASESPFIPPLDPTKGVVEEVSIEDAILYKVPNKKLPIAVSLDEQYFDKNLPNPYSSKALGINVQERTEVKSFSPLFSFQQCVQWAENSGFNSTDELELLMKPGYYKLDNSNFPCSVKINGTGVADSSVFAGKERTRTSEGRMGGYLEDSVKRGDSVYLFRDIRFQSQYGPANDAIYTNISGGLNANGSFNLSNVHIIGVNESITRNEIPDSIFTDDETLQAARRTVRNAYFIKKSIKFDTTAAVDRTGRPIGNTKDQCGLDGAIELLVKQSVDATNTSTNSFNCIAHPVVNSSDIVNSDRTTSSTYELNDATFANCRYYSIVINASDFAATDAEKLKFDRMRKYIIPGTTMYWLTGANDKVVVLSDVATVSSLTLSTKVLSVRRVNPSTSLTFTSSSTERIEVLVSVYGASDDVGQTQGNSGAYTNSIEDLNVGTWANSIRKIVFCNDDGAEFTTLTYNWALETRRKYLPKKFMHEGGYQGPVLKKVTVSVTGGSNVRTLTLDSVRDINVNDLIVWKSTDGVDRLNGFRIVSINPTAKTITLTNDVPAGVTIPADSIVSITSFDAFGNPVVKYDIPEIYGILRSGEGSNIVLVIDRNPNKIYDDTIIAYPYASEGFGNHPTQLIQLKSEYNFTAGTTSASYGSPEDASLAFSRVKASYQRINGIENDRFIFVDVDPAGFAALSDTKNNPTPNEASITGFYSENIGIHKDILVDFANYTQSTIANAGAFGKGFITTTLNPNSNNRTTIENAISSALLANNALSNTRNYNGALQVVVTGSVSSWRFYATLHTNPADTSKKMGQITGIKCYWAGTSGQESTLGEITISVVDGRGYVLSSSGNTVSTSSTLGTIDSSDFTTVCKANLLAGSPLRETTASFTGSPYLDNVLLNNTGDQIVTSARGKKIFTTWPKSYRSLRRRFPLAGMPINGNYQSTVISVDAIPGSNYKLNLTGVTIGAQSPADSAANTFGGGYLGGIIKCRGAQLTLSGTRFRGNLSLDWVGLATIGGTRASQSGGTSFIAGHSIELFQMEDQNSFQSIGGSVPAYKIRTSILDEEYLQLSEFNPKSNIYLEPSKDPYDGLADGDARTFPLATKQAIRRFNKSSQQITAWDGTVIQPGQLLSKVSLFERYQTPFGLVYDTPSGSPENGTSLSEGYVPLSGGKKASGVYLRWRDNASQTVTYTVSGGTNITLAVSQIGFFVPNNPAGKDILSNIFFGKDATTFVKAELGASSTTTFVESTYARITKTEQRSKTYDISGSTITENNAGAGKYLFVTVTYDRTNAFSSLTASNGTCINVNTGYLDSIRYNYVSTVTSRYQKVISPTNSFSKLLLETDSQGTPTYSEPANYSVSGETNSTNTNYSFTDELYLINKTKTTGTTPGRVIIKTENNKIKALNITSTGTGNVVGNEFYLSNTSAGTVDICPGFILTARTNYKDEDFALFNKGEYKVFLPQNCFIVNSIESGGSALNLKKEINAAKSIFKPGSYILYNGLYYKIAKNDAANNFSYIGAYRYVNPKNENDIRADIVVELEDISFAPTYNSNQRFDLFDNDNKLNYWPTTGRLVIGNRETCDFVKAGNQSDAKGFELRLTRSMTKYWPHYIRDWEGLDPNNSLDSTVSSESIIPTELTLADPVDVTCYGLKRINGSNLTGTDADITNRTYSDFTYVTPTGIRTTSTAKISIASDKDSLNADFEKLSIGQTVTIPYRDTGSWNTFKITIGDSQGIAGSADSTNKIGDRSISGTFRTSFSSSIDQYQTFNIHGKNNHDTSIYQYINPLTSAKVEPFRTFISTFDTRGFRSWGYMGANAGPSLAANTYADFNGVASNVEGAFHFTVSAGYAQSMVDIASYADFSAKFTQIDVTKDSYEVLMEVTAVSDGAIYRGQPIYTTGTNPEITITGTPGSGTYVTNVTSTGSYSESNLIGYVVGLAGDSISATTTTQDGNPVIVPGYEDLVSLTGAGGKGIYRVLLIAPYTSASGTVSNLTFTGGVTSTLTSLKGRKDSTDYFVWGNNQNFWWWDGNHYRYIWKRRVLDDGTNIVYFNYPNNSYTNAGLTRVTASGGTAGNDNPAVLDGDISLYEGAFVYFYYQGKYVNAIKLTLDKPLIKTIDEGIELTIAPTPNRDKTNTYLLKSRILDLKKRGSDAANDPYRIEVYLADPLPVTKWNSTNIGSSDDVSMKHFGLMYINDGGWTYPKTGGSAFRATNIKLGPAAQSQNSIYIPNLSGRIRAGDKLTYQWEDILRIKDNLGVSTCLITSNPTSGDAEIQRQLTLSGTNANLVQKFVRPGYTIYSGNTEIGTVSSVDSTKIYLTAKALAAVTSVSFTYTTTGKIQTVESTISTVTPDTDGFALCTLSTPSNHILTRYAHSNATPSVIGTANDDTQIQLLTTIGDVFVSHRLGNFTNDGPIVKSFIYSDTGVKLTFGEYGLWYENYQNYIRPHDQFKQPMSGRQGWVGNFGLNTTGRRTRGIELNGASSLQLGRQYNNGLWLSAVPVHALWEGTQYGNYMIQSDVSAQVDSNYTLTLQNINYDGNGTQSLYPLNHTSLTTGSIYVGYNAGDVVSDGGGAYDTQHYKFVSTGAKLRYSLLDGTVENSTGTVTGGFNSRLSEQLTIKNIINYTPFLNNSSSATALTTSITISSSSSIITGLTAAEVRKLQPGDVLYTGSTLYSGTFIGIIKTIDYTTPSITLVENSKVNQTSAAVIHAISPRAFRAGTAGTNFGSLGLVISGDADTSATATTKGGSSSSYNVIGSDAPGYDKYNLKFGVEKRVYNQSTLLNTYTNLKAVDKFDSASRVIDIKFGDLATYTSPILNVEVTRFNPKTHVESSVSVVGKNLHI
jgi:hypothetical protein